MKRTPETKAAPQCGIVTSVDVQSCRAKVYLPLLDTETDWIRIGSSYVGAGWGIRAPLHTGNEVLVVFVNNDLNEGHIVCAFWGEEGDAPPAGAGGFILHHESGSCIRFGNDGSITLIASDVSVERL